MYLKNWLEVGSAIMDFFNIDSVSRLTAPWGERGAVRWETLGTRLKVP